MKLTDITEARSPLVPLVPLGKLAETLKPLYDDRGWKPPWSKMKTLSFMSPDDIEQAIKTAVKMQNGEFELLLDMGFNKLLKEARLIYGRIPPELETDPLFNPFYKALTELVYRGESAGTYGALASQLASDLHLFSNTYRNKAFSDMDEAAIILKLLGMKLPT